MIGGKLTMKDCEFINKDNLTLFANTNGHLLKKAPHAVVLEFPGLGGSSCLGGNLVRGPYEGEYAEKLADEGILLVYTFPGPWSWMNRGAVRYCDLVTDAAFDAYGIDRDAPLIATGGSMGGLGALIFTIESRHHVCACAAACPCYNALESCLNSGIMDFPRTFISSAACEDAPFEETLKRISPRFRINDMPDIPYFIVGDGDDEDFPIAGMDEYVAALRAHTPDVTYRSLPGCYHGCFTPEARNEFTEFVIRHAGR